MISNRSKPTYTCMLFAQQFAQHLLMYFVHNNIVISNSINKQLFCVVNTPLELHLITLC